MRVSSYRAAIWLGLPVVYLLAVAIVCHAQQSPETQAPSQPPTLEPTSPPQQHPPDAPEDIPESDPLPVMFPHPETDRYWISGQANFIFQAHPSFHALYSGPHS